MQAAQILTFLAPLIIVALIMRRNMRGRKLVLERIWIYPALMALGAGALLYEGPPPETWTILLYAAALAVGAAVGWYRGRLTQISVDPATHEITSKGTVAGMILVLGVFGIRYGLRYFLMSPEGAGALSLGAARAADALILFAVGTMIVQRIEMGLRAKRLLDETKAAKANADLPSP